MDVVLLPLGVSPGAVLGCVVLRPLCVSLDSTWGGF